MPANSTHPDYDLHLAAWLRARDVLAGEDAVKAAAERYLPKLQDQALDEYLAYKQRAAFFNATSRTAEGFLGLIFRRRPTVHVATGAATPPSGDHTTDSHLMDLDRPTSGLGRALAEFLADADLQGTTLDNYAKEVVGEVLAVGRAGTLVDWEGGSSASRTGGYGEQRAYVVRYAAEDILNWRSERVNGRQTLTLVALRENVETRNQKAESDDFERETVEQIRVLRLREVGGEKSEVRGKYQYEVEVWRQERGKGGRGKLEWVLTETRTPLRLGQPLPLIPFVFHGPRHSLPAVDKLPLADVIAVNLDHYRLDADYKHGLHFTALPTAWVSGFDKGDDLRIGSRTAWTSETVGATAGFLEFKGQGLGAFERAMDRDERLMAALGTRLLEPQKRVGETAEAIELRQSGETSALTTLSLSVSESLTRVLRWVYWWNSTEERPEEIGPERVLVQLNEDFSTKTMTSQELSAVVAAWQAGAISRETMLDLFRAGEVLPAGRSNEEEEKLARRAKGNAGGVGD